MDPVSLRLQAEPLILQALREDVTSEDVTTASVIGPEAVGRVQLIAKQDGVICGLDVFARTFELLDATTTTELSVSEGDDVREGQVLGSVHAHVRALLSGERVALNYLQRMSGIATMTRAFVDAVDAAPGSHARIADTRKTVPGLRPFDKYAVVCGGGRNHRYGLSDAVMVKDNHIAAMQAAGLDLTAGIKHIRDQVGHTTHIEVEVDRLDQIPAVLEGGADTIMLDNFSLEDTRKGVAMIAGRAIVEASGTMTLERVPQVASTGVDVISVGALTHSVRAIDLGLDWA